MCGRWLCEAYGEVAEQGNRRRRALHGHWPPSAHRQGLAHHPCGGRPPAACARAAPGLQTANSLFVSHPREAYELFATAATDNTAKLWDVRTQRCVRTFSGGPWGPWGLLPDGRWRGGTMCAR